MRVDEIARFVEGIPATFKERKGLYSVEFTVAERKAFLTKKKLTYSARFRIDEDKKELRFTEMLKESGSGGAAQPPLTKSHVYVRAGAGELPGGVLPRFFQSS